MAMGKSTKQNNQDNREDNEIIEKINQGGGSIRQVLKEEQGKNQKSRIDLEKIKKEWLERHETRNREHETGNMEQKTRNTKHEARSMEQEIVNLKNQDEAENKKNNYDFRQKLENKQNKVGSEKLEVRNDKQYSKKNKQELNIGEKTGSQKEKAIDLIEYFNIPAGEYEFPKSFLWGTASSAYQTEGGIKNNWSQWEQSMPRLTQLMKQDKRAMDYICNLACDSYNRYEKDFDLAQGLNNNAVRFGIEWARIQPEKDAWDIQALNHYREVLKAAKKRGFITAVTLWHWTIPDWLAEQGGWESKRAIECFSNFADMVVQDLGADIDYWITLNEPMAPIGFGYMIGAHPPAHKLSLLKARRVYKNLLSAHREAYRIIHKHFPYSKVGLTMLMNYIEPARKWLPPEWLIAKIARYFSHEIFLKRAADNLDFIGLNYYKRTRIVWYPPFMKNKQSALLNDMNWNIYPKGIYKLLKRAGKFGKPILITENGIADASDSKRKNYIKSHLYWIYRAIQEGVDVKGYFHWSLLDNFEWAWGWKPKFGLYAVDRRTFERTPKPSAEAYREICKNNRLVIR